jgi:hypothetical protein
LKFVVPDPKEKIESITLSAQALTGDPVTPAWDFGLLPSNVFVEIDERKGEAERAGKPFDWVGINTSHRYILFKFETFGRARAVFRLREEAQRAQTVNFWLADVWDVESEKLKAVARKGMSETISLPLVGPLKIDSVYDFSRCSSL